MYWAHLEIAKDANIIYDFQLQYTTRPDHVSDLYVYKSGLCIKFTSKHSPANLWRCNGCSLTSYQKVVDSSPTVEENFSFCNFHLLGVLRSSTIDNLMQMKISCIALYVLSYVIVLMNMVITQNYPYYIWQYDGEKFSLGCSSVIEYSRNLIWPQSIFFILSVWCWFSYGMLINSNNVCIWGIIQICKIFARIWQISFLL